MTESDIADAIYEHLVDVIPDENARQVTADSIARVLVARHPAWLANSERLAEYEQHAESARHDAAMQRAEANRAQQQLTAQRELWEADKAKLEQLTEVLMELVLSGHLRLEVVTPD